MTDELERAARAAYDWLNENTTYVGPYRSGALVMVDGDIDLIELARAVFASALPVGEEVRQIMCKGQFNSPYGLRGAFTAAILHITKGADDAGE